MISRFEQFRILILLVNGDYQETYISAKDESMAKSMVIEKLKNAMKEQGFYQTTGSSNGVYINPMHVIKVKAAITAPKVGEDNE